MKHAIILMVLMLSLLIISACTDHQKPTVINSFPEVNMKYDLIAKDVNMKYDLIAKDVNTSIINNCSGEMAGVHYNIIISDDYVYKKISTNDNFTKEIILTNDKICTLVNGTYECKDELSDEMSVVKNLIKLPFFKCITTTFDTTSFTTTTN